MQIIKYLSLIIFCSLLLPCFLFAINHPPVFIPSLTRGVALGDTLIFTLTAYDPDGDQLFWSVENLPPNAQFNVLTQTLFWIPVSAGTYNVIFSIDDAQGNLIRKTIEMKAVNKGEWFIVRLADIKGGVGKIFFVNDTTGWALGAYGSIVHTDDGGTTWVVQKGRDTLNYYLDLWFSDEKKGWVLGNAHTIFHTDDGVSHGLSK